MRQACAGPTNKKKSHFRPEGFALVSAVQNRDLNSYRRNIFTPSHSPMTPSVQTTRYQTKTRLWILSISCIVPGLFPVFSLLKADMSISRVAKLCDVVHLYCEVSSLALIHSMDVLEKNDRGSRIRSGGSGIDVTGSIIMKSSIFFEKNENLNWTL